MNSLKIVHENDANIAAMLPGNPHAIGAPDLFVESSARSCVDGCRNLSIGLDALTDDLNSGGPDTVNSLMLYAVRQHMNT